MVRQGKRCDLLENITSTQVGRKLETAEIIGKEIGESKNQVRRYIRLTNLLPAIDYAQAIPSLSQAQRIKRMAQNNEITQEGMNIILSEEKKADLDKMTLKEDVLKKYFPKSYTLKQMEDTIIKLLEQWQKKRERDMSR